MERVGEGTRQQGIYYRDLVDIDNKQETGSGEPALPGRTHQEVKDEAWLQGKINTPAVLSAAVYQ